MRSSTARAWRLLALTVSLLITAAPATRGQVNEQISGTVESIWGPTLVLRTNPPPPRRVTFGESARPVRSEEHTSELQSRPHLVCRLLLEKKKKKKKKLINYKKKKKKKKKKKLNTKQ